MARDFIKITQSAPVTSGAPLLLQYVNAMRTAYDLGQRVLAIMTHNNDGTDFTDIETLFGLPTGKGQAVFDLVNGSTGAMVGTFQTADCKTLTEIVGG